MILIQGQAGRARRMLLAFAAVVLAGALGAAPSLAAPPPDPFDAQIVRLARCAPTTEAQALRCLDHALTRSERRAVLALRFEDLHPTGDGGWSAAILYAWDEPFTAPPLKLYYRHLGYPVDRDWSLGETVLASWWLTGHGCRLDHRKRAERDRSIDETLREEADAVRRNPDMRGLTHPERAMHEFRPSCPVRSRP